MIKRMKAKLALTLIGVGVLIVLAFALPVRAQLPIGTDNFVATLDPTLPLPNQPVKITVEDYAFDITRSEVQWSVGGATRQSGIGQNTFTVVAGSAGSTITVNVSVIPSDGEPTVQHSISIQPS